MLSRVADSLFWMSRYIERADGILRMLKINYASSQDDVQEFSWRPVLKIFTYLEDDKIDVLENNTRGVLQYMVTDKENPNSVLNIVTQARENARSVQDHITKEMWQCLNDFYHTMRDEKLVPLLQKEDPVTILDILIRQGLLYVGTTDVTMARGEGNSFINIGKFLERGIQSTDILDVKFSVLNARDIDEPSDTTYWKYMLLSISGYELYLRTYRGGFEAKNVVEQIVLGEDFPRSVIYSISQLHRYFERLRSDRSNDAYDQLNFVIGKLKSRVKFSTSNSIMHEGLHQYLYETRAGLVEIGNTLNKNYFA
ncbi:alpha-E domain-containing protein [Ferruginibacter sp. HRS2-29]|uniref:alpha-E domain-containing protein n=1 Tax=Ferruginibacter sp. HRS2-29 TaxID=2487334 RepID=UPI0020CD51EC|nr:alpha-E domain-containing protein [Ferruginibacter sp. HRS2-29]MCP9752191.1 alpha-E domain-containing protein [Ferruginibacter sp. HRS2-29]